VRRDALRILVVSLGLASVASSARADDVTKKAMAESLFQEGLDLFDKGKTDEACDRFDKSQSLDPKLSTLMNLATCRERQGHTATAWEEFTEAASQAEKQGSADRAKVAHDKANALSSKLSKVKLVKIADTPGMALSLDGKSLDAGMIGESVPIDPGNHHIEVSAPGYSTFTHDFTVQSGPTETPVEIPALPKVTTPEPQPVEPQPVKPEEPKERVRPKKPHREISPVAIASYAIGGASLLVGIGTGAASIVKTNAIPCKHCDATHHEEIANANGLANASNATFAIAGVATIIGIVFTVTSLSSSNDEQAIEFVPTGDVGAGMRVHF
jgi:hypothetical protein